jgi:hypothetical protein
LQVRQTTPFPLATDLEKCSSSNVCPVTFARVEACAGVWLRSCVILQVRVCVCVYLCACACLCVSCVACNSESDQQAHKPHHHTQIYTNTENTQTHARNHTHTSKHSKHTYYNTHKRSHTLTRAHPHARAQLQILTYQRTNAPTHHQAPTCARVGARLPVKC